MSARSPGPPCCPAEGPAVLVDGMERELARERTLLRRKVSVAAVLTVLVMGSSLPHMLGLHSLPLLPFWFTSPWTQLILTTPAPFRLFGSTSPT